MHKNKGRIYEWYDIDTEIVWLAALLHDIGEFWQGAGVRGSHEELSSRLIQDYMPERWHGAAGIVGLHHNSNTRYAAGYKLEKTIVCAYWLSSEERRETDDRGECKSTPLMSIFSCIDTGKDRPLS